MFIRLTFKCFIYLCALLANSASAGRGWREQAELVRSAKVLDPGFAFTGYQGEKKPQKLGFSGSQISCVTDKCGTADI